MKPIRRALLDGGSSATRSRYPQPHLHPRLTYLVGAGNRELLRARVRSNQFAWDLDALVFDVDNHPTERPAMTTFEGLTRLDRVRENINVAAYAANYTAQVLEDTKLRSLIDMEAFDDGIWKEMAAPAWHTGTRPRRIDLTANSTVERAIRRYKPDAVVRSEELEGTYDDSPGTDLFLTDPYDGTENGRALGAIDSTVVLSFSIGADGERIFNGAAISTSSVQVHYTVYNRIIVEAQILIPPRGVHIEPKTSDIKLMQSFDRIVPGDPRLIAVLGARAKHRSRPEIRALLGPANPAWVVGVAGTPLTARLACGPLGSVISPSVQKLRDVAHAPLLAGLAGGLVTDLQGNSLPVLDLFETADELPPSISASSAEALRAVLDALSTSGPDRQVGGAPG